MERIVIHILMQTGGCDSVHTLNLTINSSSTGTSSATACDSYIWDGVSIHNKWNIYQYLYQCTTGCDSVHTLNLTINSSNTGTSSATACDSYIWDGLHTQQVEVGCDSVHTLT